MVFARPCNLVSVALAFGALHLSLAGCLPNPSTSRSPIADPAAVSALMIKVPAELRWQEPAEDPAAQERYIKAMRAAVRASELGMSRTPRTGSHSLDISGLEEIRQAIRSGPVQQGFDEALIIGSEYGGAFSPAAVSGLLLQSSSQALRAKNKQLAIDDLGLALKWMVQTGGIFNIDMGRSYDFFNVLQSLSLSPSLTAEERQKILKVLPTDEELKRLQEEMIKQLLEARICSLAVLTAPRTDLVVGQMYSNIGYPLANTADPKNAILVPPHGTLDKDKTLEALVELSRISIVSLDAPMDDTSINVRKTYTDFVKWLPPVPGQLMTKTKKERDYMRKKIDSYVEEMNKGENTLGRQFIQSWPAFNLAGNPSLRQNVANLRRNLMAGAPRQASKD